LGKLGEATVQMNERVKDLARLEQALKPPKARGGFGELLLENLLRDALPPSHYQLQYGFRGGERVDAVIRVERLVPVDAKFPLDNFHRLVEAADDSERQIHEKAFGRDLKTHIDAIAGKYIRPAEGTYDFAFMYVPSESVYYELVCGKTGALYTYALSKRVFPVSPTTFSAYLQVIVFGLRGLQVEKHAQEVMASITQLQKDFGRFKEDFDLVGTHLGRAQSKFGEAEKRLDRFEGRLEQTTEHREIEATVDVSAVGDMAVTPALDSIPSS
jgi:DNA recombination protein RmuC